MDMLRRNNVKVALDASLNIKPLLVKLEQTYGEEKDVSKIEALIDNE